MRIITAKPNITRYFQRTKADDLALEFSYLFPSIKLAHNDVGPTGGQMLGAWLASGSRLSVIDLTATNIGTKGLKCVLSEFFLP